MNSMLKLLVLTVGILSLIPAVGLADFDSLNGNPPEIVFNDGGDVPVKSPDAEPQPTPTPLPQDGMVEPGPLSSPKPGAPQIAFGGIRQPEEPPVDTI